MMDPKSLELTIERSVPGELITNALAIQAFVEERIKDYAPEKFYDDPDRAKKERSVLNAASKELNTRRLALERDFMRPFDDFKAIIKATTTRIDYASAKLDEIVKAVEETQKNEERRDIEAIFEKKAFTLAALDRLFDPRWLNKGMKIKDIQDELDAKIKKIYGDIEIIEALPEDALEVKAQYLETLDIGAALGMAQRLKANRERIAQEARDREDRKHQEHLADQAVILGVDASAEAIADEYSSLAAEALEIEKDPIIEYTLRFKGTKAQLIALRTYMTAQGIEYTKVEE
jgi:hypothetical protein